MRRLDTAYLDRTTDWLAPWATKHSKAVSRLVAEPTGLTPSRTHFQRDRDRIIHARAFRRLAYKTQVYSTDESDHTRTRLTHTLEVFQIARGIGRLLGLNEDLIEAISFAHDLGHTPFGHAGEKALDRVLRKKGELGFLHNLQGLRVVDLLEDKRNVRQLGGDGLNLTWAVREGILKHTDDRIEGIYESLEPKRPGSLEAQVVRVADKIAYTAADWEDADRTGVFGEMIREGVITNEERLEWLRRFNSNDEWGYSGIINTLVRDVVATTQEKLRDLRIRSEEDVAALGEPIVAIGEFAPTFDELKTWLAHNVYRSTKASISDSVGDRIVESLFEEYMETPETLPLKVRAAYERADGQRCPDDGFPQTPARVVADYIAGMTDRYAIESYQRLFL